MSLENINAIRMLIIMEALMLANGPNFVKIISDTGIHGL